MLPAQIFSEPSGFVSRATSSGKSLYSMTSEAAFDADHVAHLFQWIALRDHLRRHLGIGQNVIADVLRAGDIDQRVIDLEVEQLADAAASSSRRRASRRSSAKAASMPPCPLGLSARRSALPKHAARRRIHRRHRALAENVQVFGSQPKAIMLGEKADRLLVRGRDWSSNRAESARDTAAP